VTCEGKSDVKLRFIVFQLLRALERLHADGIAYDQLHPLTVGLTPRTCLFPLFNLHFLAAMKCGIFCNRAVGVAPVVADLVTGKTPPFS
jgi:hypothetical protein